MTVRSVLSDVCHYTCTFPPTLFLTKMISSLQMTATYCCHVQCKCCMTKISLLKHIRVVKPGLNVSFTFLLSRRWRTRHIVIWERLNLVPNWWAVNCYDFALFWTKASNAPILHWDIIIYIALVTKLTLFFVLYYSWTSGLRHVTEILVSKVEVIICPITLFVDVSPNFVDRVL